MKKLLLILLCLPFIGFGQGWERTFGGGGGEEGKVAKLTTDGGYIIAGSTASFLPGKYSFYLVKTDVNGIEEWYKTFGGAELDYARSVQQTSDGGYIMTGFTYSFGSGRHLYIVKTDVNGVQQWYKTFQVGFEGLNIEQTLDGGYIVSGAILIKTDINGDSIWTKNLGPLNTIKKARQTSDTGYIITGKNANHLHLIKTDSIGDSLWIKTYINSGITSSGNDVQQTIDGGYIVTGFTDTFGNGDKDVYLIKTDENGVEQWTKTFGGTGHDIGHSVQQTTDGGYIIAGETALINGDSDVYLIKTDLNGDSLWTKKFGGTNLDWAYYCEQISDGGFIVCGTTLSFGNGSQVYLIKTDGSGNVTSTFNIPINPNRKLEKVVDILGRETKPQTNTPFIEIYDDGTVEKRIVIE